MTGADRHMLDILWARVNHRLRLLGLSEFANDLPPSMGGAHLKHFNDMQDAAASPTTHNVHAKLLTHSAYSSFNRA